MVSEINLNYKVLCPLNGEHTACPTHSSAEPSSSRRSCRSKTLHEISFQALRDRGFKGVVFDKDNTLMVTNASASLAAACSFSPTRSAPVTTLALKRRRRSKAELQCAVLRHNQKKPDGIDHVKAYFGAAAMGDRYSTEMLFGNLHGLLTIRTDQFAHEGESAVNALMQKIESRLIERLVRAGVVAPIHPLVVDTAAFASEVVVQQKRTS